MRTVRKAAESHPMAKKNLDLLLNATDYSKFVRMMKLKAIDVSKIKREKERECVCLFILKIIHKYL